MKIIQHLSILKTASRPQIAQKAKDVGYSQGDLHKYDPKRVLC